MSIFDGLLDKMRLSSDDDYDDDLEEELDDDEDDEEEVAPAPKKSKGIGRIARPSREEEDKPEPVSKPKPVARAAASNKVVRYNKGNGMEVCVFKPTNIEDGREIADTLLDGKAVVLNLEGIDVNLAQRIIDFTSGSCYSIRGNLQKVANYIFIVTPESVDISGDFQELISTNDLGFHPGNNF